MRLRLFLLIALVPGAGHLTPRFTRAQTVPFLVTSEGVPAVPEDLEQIIDRYRFSDHASFQGWLAGTRRILYLSESEGVEQAFLCERPGQSPRQLTASNRSISWVYSHPGRERLVIATDEHGDERYHFDLQDIATGTLWIFANRRWRNEAAVWSRSGNLLALSSNARNGKDEDLYVIDPPIRRTGRRLMEATGTLAAQSWSPDDRRLAAIEWAPDSKSTRVHLIEMKTGKVETLPQPAGEPVSRKRVRWSPDGGSLYWLTDFHSEFMHLARYDFAAKKETPLTDAIPWDVDQYAVIYDGSAALLVVNEDGWTRLHMIDLHTGKERLAPPLPAGKFGAITFRRGTREFAFEWSCAQSPPGIYSFDLATLTKTTWVKPIPVSSESYRVPGHQSFHYPTFDGRMIPAYIRRPGPKFRRPSPVLVIVHGGPAAQYRPGFSLLENYLLGELGVTLVMPNIRGSTGYGRSFEKLDDGRHRDDAVRDLGALLDWISTQPDLDATHVAVSGGSHGGYLALAALVRYGDRLLAGIDISGVSDFESSLKSEPASTIDYWRTEYGDERDPEMLSFLRSISPLRNANAIRKPLLVAHGNYDTRVKIGEAKQIVAAVRRNNTPVWYMRFEGEGHDLKRRENANYLMHAQILFLKQFLTHGP